MERISSLPMGLSDNYGFSGFNTRRPSAFAISQRFWSAQTNVRLSAGKFKAMANWMLSTGFIYFLRIRLSALMMSSGVVSRTEMLKLLMS